ncbi:MAG: hypothetical protein AAFU61_17680, partial [Pseudomonadota bacterium]
MAPPVPGTEHLGAGMFMGAAAAAAAAAEDEDDGGEQGKTAPAFLEKLYDILEDPAYQDYIS